MCVVWWTKGSWGTGKEFKSIWSTGQGKGKEEGMLRVMKFFVWLRRSLI
jgi:hypothetical protein